MVLEITLDWDNCSITEARQRIAVIKEFWAVKTIMWRFSATKGLHVKVKFNYPLSKWQALKLRQIWKDDGNRIVLDVMGRGARPPMVLWDSKYKKGFEFKATEWMGYERL